MITEFGHFALILAFMVALLQSSLPLIGASLNRHGLMAFAMPAATAQFVLVLAAFGALTHAFVTSDFSVQLVVLNSHSLKPMIYKISGVWGNHEGSLLLWILILALFGACAAWFGQNLTPTFRARVIAVQGMIGASFLAFCIFTVKPVPTCGARALGRTGFEPLVAGPRFGVSSPVFIFGVCGPFYGVFLCCCGPDRRAC
jgi:cytochrome c-type biogenesis protein CcmF